ncbi:MAG: nucleotidyltransferase domain-containing protein [Planctomycetota bacterium]
MQLDALKWLEDIRRAAAQALEFVARGLDVEHNRLHRSAAERVLEQIGMALARLGAIQSDTAACLPHAGFFADLGLKLSRIKPPVSPAILREALGRLPELHSAARDLLARFGPAAVREAGQAPRPPGQPNALVTSKDRELADLCRRYGVARLELFGSATTSAFDPQRSDLDFLVEFLPDERAAGGGDYFGLLSELERLFGCRVDLVEPRGIDNPYFRIAVERQRMLLYAA